MTGPEIERLTVLQSVCQGHLSQMNAASSLGISTRQVRRLVGALKRDGPKAVVSKRRGKRPNNRIDDRLRALVLDCYRLEYRDFGPTFLAQALLEREGISVSREWLRRHLIQSGMWKAKRRKRNVHPLRQRRARFGELLQMDGSPHDWFEGRGPRCTLLVAIDDATSRVTAARFELAETSAGYFTLVRAHIERYGRFCAAYTDKHSIFRYSGSSTDRTITTQLQRAFDELEIELICANTPQAKGRVERANRTFQDRLIKSMRLEKIDTLEAANSFLPKFLEDHNNRFAIAPASDENAHRDKTCIDLDRILCRREERIVTKNLMFQIDDDFYTLVDPFSRKNLATGSRLQVQIPPSGIPRVFHGDHVLEAHGAGKRLRNAPIVSSKDLNERVDRHVPNPKKGHVPPRTHPWRTPFPTP